MWEKDSYRDWRDIAREILDTPPELVEQRIAFADAMDIARMRAPKIRVGGLWGRLEDDPLYMARSATCAAIAIGRRR